VARVVNNEQQTIEQLLAPLREHPALTALFFDVDGTLAPVVERAYDASVPVSTSQLLGELASRYALVACVSGRPASEARRLVGVGSVWYAGSHGAELLRAGAAEPEILPDLARWRSEVRGFAARHDDFELRRSRVRIEDKDFIQAFHWRGVEDELTARTAIERIAEDALAEGLAVHHGRKVLEVRPPVEFHKGVVVERLVSRSGARAALYVGDDATDADAFAALHELRHSGVLETALCVAVLSEETPALLREDADLELAGQPAVPGLLRILAD
jgi:trehalose 6-phosphate phosphatase